MRRCYKQKKIWWSLQHDWLLFNKPFYKQSVASITKDIKFIDLYMNFLDMNFNMNFIICCILKRSDLIFTTSFSFFFIVFFLKLMVYKHGCRRIEFIFLFLWISFDYNKPFIDMNMRFIVQFGNLIFILFQTLYGRIYYP